MTDYPFEIFLEPTDEAITEAGDGPWQGCARYVHGPLFDEVAESEGNLYTVLERVYNHIMQHGGAHSDPIWFPEQIEEIERALANAGRPAGNGANDSD